MFATWLRKRTKTLDLLPAYLKAIYRRANEYVWEEVLVAPIILWWMFGNPPTWLVVELLCGP